MMLKIEDETQEQPITLKPGTWVLATHPTSRNAERGVILDVSTSTATDRHVARYYWIVFPRFQHHYCYRIVRAGSIRRLIDKAPVSDSRLRRLIKKGDVRMPLKNGTKIRYMRDGALQYGYVTNLCCISSDDKEATYNVGDKGDGTSSRCIEVQDGFIDKVFEEGKDEDGQPPKEKDASAIAVAIIFVATAIISMTFGVLMKDGLMAFVKSVGEVIKSIGS